jgi:hypothetical protein
MRVAEDGRYLYLHNPTNFPTSWNCRGEWGGQVAIDSERNYGRLSLRADRAGWYEVISVLDAR